MRKVLKMTYKGYNVERGYKGHRHMNYRVVDVKVLDTTELVIAEYWFEASTVFKGLGLKEDDFVTGEFDVVEKEGRLRLLRPKNVTKLISE